MLKIHRELQARTSSAVAGNILLLVFMLYLFGGSEEPIIALLAFNIVMNLVRVIWVQKLDQYRDNVVVWNYGLLMILGSIGTAWGMSSSLVLLEYGVSSMEAVTALFILACIGASAAADLSVRFSLAFVYLLMALGVPAITLMNMDLHNSSKFLPIFFVIYIVFLLSQAKVQSYKFLEMVQQEELFRSIVDSVPMGVILRTVGGENSFVKLMNPQAADIWEVNKSAIGQRVDQVFGHALGIRMEEWAEAAKKEKVAIQQAFMIELRGEEKHLRRQTLYLEQLQAVLEIYEDVSQDKRAEKQIQELRASNIHKEKMASLGEMAGGIAHEINNPLAIIQGKVAQIRRMFESAKEEKLKVLENLDKIDSTVGRIAKIVHGLRVFSRSGEHDPFEESSILKIAQEAMYLCMERFKASGINLEIQVKGDSVVECRHVQVSQVIVNLLNNSFDAVQSLEQKWVRITLEEDSVLAIVRVTDSGPGIQDPQIVAKLMQPFFTTKEVGKGTGLGLSISKGLIESQGGRFYLNQTCPNTEFVIELPKYKTPDQVRSA